MTSAKVGKSSAQKIKSSDVDVDNVLSVLQKETREQILQNPNLKVILNGLSKDISNSAAFSKNESEVVSVFETRVYKFLSDVFNLNLNFEKEIPVATVRHVAKGRIDSRVGAVVIEYKHSTKLTSASAQQSATNQISNYLTSLPKQPGQSLIGLVTDGVKAQVVNCDEHGSITAGPFEALNSSHIEHVIRSALLLDKTALTPDNLVKDFCKSRATGPSVVGRLVAALYKALSTEPTDRAKMLFSEWQTLFRLAHDDASKQEAIIQRRTALGAALEISIEPGDNQTEYRALYALQTAFAIIVKIVALKVISAVRNDSDLISFEDLAAADNTAIRGKLDRLEAGDVFRDMGFGNLLEGDFFAWYCTEGQWNQDISAAVKEVFVVLTEYESQPLFQGAEGVKDFFKDLYMHVIPAKVRHSLGEFYTPPWLADHVVSRALQETGKVDGDWSGVDPCCGSGTFLTVMLQQKIGSLSTLPKAQILARVLKEVKGIDLNPLAVLTARINYFINISSLIEPEDVFEIPVYLGDSSYVPEPEDVGGVQCVKYQIQTLEGVIDVILPRSAISDVSKFSNAMTLIETHIKNQDESKVLSTLFNLCDSKDKTPLVKSRLTILAAKLVELETKDWNGIWARIITNFLTTANLGKFDVIVGNPPWIDWKNLPAGYRERISKLCISRKLFSGDGITGGINLNICALIANVAAENWLSDEGVLAFLMPEPIMFQQSYEGFRRLLLTNGERLYFQGFDDWTKSGHPFAPVQQPFLTYLVSKKEQDYSKGIPVIKYTKKRSIKGAPVKPLSFFKTSSRFQDVRQVLNTSQLQAVTSSASSTVFSYSAGDAQSAEFRQVFGVCSYHGREGIEFYPQELFLLECLDKKAPAGKVFVENYQNSKSKHKVAKGQRLLETDFLHPLIKGTDISRFGLASSRFVVPFPYENMSRSPMDRGTLAERSPQLMKYLNDNKGVIEAQTSYNERIIGKKHHAEFYALARVGEYTYGEHFVAYRDNTKWGAVVVSSIETPWGKTKRPVFQNHAVSISQTSDGRFISENEAHFICAVLNAPIVAKFLLSRSDSRSFKIRPPVNLPVYDSENVLHVKLSNLSKAAHAAVNNGSSLAEIDEELDVVYKKLLDEMNPVELH